MPRTNPVIPMTSHEFSVMEHRLGWKHEYVDGHALLTLQDSAVVDWEIGPDSILQQNRELSEGMTSRLVRVTDRAELVKLYIASFEDAVEYSGCEPDYFLQDAADSVGSFFGMQTVHTVRQSDIGLPEASFVIEIAGNLVAAILVRPSHLGAMIEPVMVTPNYQRSGLAGILLRTSLVAMERSRELLHSQSHLSNPVSFAWHERHGFREINNIYSSAHRAIHFDRLSKYYEHQSDSVTAQSMRKLSAEWQRIHDQLQEQLRPWAR